MTVKDEQQDSIQYVKFSGPAVDALDQRKENNDGHRFSAAQFRANLARVRDNVMHGIGVIVAAGDQRAKR